MRIRVIVTLLILLGPLGYLASGQSDRAPEASDAIRALVAELRAVRAELTAGSQRQLRFQLLLARLQIQEQRIAHLDRQRASIADKLMDTTTMVTMFASQFKDFDDACRGAQTADERKACEGQMEAMKAQVTTQQAAEQQLKMQEVELANAIATEQARWSEFSARLDELERSLKQ